ncbi:hypothetical protein FHX44_116477 [Pseudonocardia hierapolitana]|uniref:Uncharacterized protein n=1 Tax=Pseudonocardia hierapolitana TaxID=1128676 RepID=A0A561T0A2_9PSEU|nr:ferredoxin-NADPH reductase [Pseudonocardia hierapolitana]TWF80534.1 hypothetical protein FHX44_116477 [Pseudonocardia hierapolitana]
MSGLRAALRRPDTYEVIFEIAYLGLGAAACLGGAALPLVAAVTLLADPLAAWPTLLVAALPLGAGVAGAFHAFGAAWGRGVPAPFRDAWEGVRRHAGRATAVWGLLCALLFVVVVDVLAIWATPWAAVIGPLLAALVLLGGPTAIIALAGLSRMPGLPLLALLRASAWLAVRRAPLTLLSLVVLAGWGMVCMAQPVAGLLGVGGFALYVLWSNSVAAWTSVG